MKKDDLLYFLRLIIGLLMGVVSGFLSSSFPWFLIGILGILAYGATIPLSIRLVVEDTSAKKRSAIINGIGTYVLFWITGWILFYNLIY